MRIAKNECIQFPRNKERDLEYDSDQGEHRKGEGHIWIHGKPDQNHEQTQPHAQKTVIVHKELFLTARKHRDSS